MKLEKDGENEFDYNGCSVIYNKNSINITQSQKDYRGVVKEGP